LTGNFGQLLKQYFFLGGGGVVGGIKEFQGSKNTQEMHRYGSYRNMQRNGTSTHHTINVSAYFFLKLMCDYSRKIAALFSDSFLQVARNKRCKYGALMFQCIGCNVAEVNRRGLG
jgi:hypothetical protein